MSVSKKIRPTVTVNLDKERTLLVDFNALAEMEDLLGESALTGEIFTEDKLRQVKYLRVITYAALKHEDDSLTLKDVGAMLNLQNIGYVMEKVGQALTASVGEPKASDGEKGKL